MVYFLGGILGLRVTVFFALPRRHTLLSICALVRCDSDNRAREAHQTGVLLRRYFRKGDVYVHSDLEGSIVVIVKNTRDDAGIPPGTLSQAGVMAVATSRAWDAKQAQPFLPSPISPCTHILWSWFNLFCF